jgi:hypothetical protein
MIMRSKYWLLLLGLLFTPVLSEAKICTIDEVPAATLLLPYFEVDLDSANGMTTLLEINNAFTTPQVANVVIWSDLSVAVHNFNVLLDGLDIASINLRDVLNQPPTVGGGAGCVGDPASGQLTQDIQDALTGRPVTGAGGVCFGVDHGDNIARGYITVDVVDRCTEQIPGDPGYFLQGGSGVATNDNALWGNYYYVDPSENLLFSETLVHIEADASDPETSTPGQYTFYGRYVGWTAADNREPLATNFAARYLQMGSTQTDFVVWRDSKRVIKPFLCGLGPPAVTFPLTLQSSTILDETGNVDFPMLRSSFPWQTQRVLLDQLSFNAGWIFLDLNAVGALGNPPEDPGATQNWVTPLVHQTGRFSVGYDAIQYDSACSANHMDPTHPGD